MSKNTDFSQLGPKSHKNWVRIGIGLKILIATRREVPTRRFHARARFSIVAGRWFDSGKVVWLDRGSLCFDSSSGY